MLISGDGLKKKKNAILGEIINNCDIDGKGS